MTRSRTSFRYALPLLLLVAPAQAQEKGVNWSWPGSPRVPFEVQSQLQVPTPSQTPAPVQLPSVGPSIPLPASPGFPPSATQPSQSELGAIQQNLASLNQELTVARVAAVQDDKLKAQVEILQKQIE